MSPTPTTAPMHAVNDNAAQPAEPLFDHPTALDHPVTRAAFQEAMASLSGSRSLLASVPLDQIVDGDPRVGDPGEIVADLRAGRI